MKHSLLVSLFALVLVRVSAQYSASDLAYHADAMTNLMAAQHRERAHDLFEEQLMTYLETGPFGQMLNLPTVNQLYAADSSFCLYNYELLLDSTARYFGVLDFRDSSIEPVVLADQSVKLGNMTRETLGADEWWGSFIYRMEPMMIDSQQSYLLFGLNKYSPAYNRKICDVLTVDADGGVKFGAPIFVKVNESTRDDVRKRVILTYSDPANVSLNFDPTARVIAHNHILAIPEQSFEGEPLLAQDGTYEVYRWQDNRFVYDEYMFEQNLEKAGQQEGAATQRMQRDLMGRPTKGN